MVDGAKGVENFPQAKTRDVVAEQVGFGSGRQYDKAKFIDDNADLELIKQLDEKQISIHAAYQKLKKEKEDALQQVEQLKEEKNKIKLVSKSRHRVSVKTTSFFYFVEVSQCLRQNSYPLKTS